MAEITESLLEAMRIVFAHAIQTSGLDKTVQGTITGVQGSDKYKVQIAGTDYTIPCAIQMSFTLGDTVWITIPGGNFKNKYISGKAAK